MQAQRQYDEDHQQVDDIDDIAAGQEGQGRQRHGHQRQQGAIDLVAHTFFTCSLPPKRPCGRSSSTTMMATNGATTMALVEMNSPTRFSATPITKPPTTAPGRLVMPPTMAAA
ncbi:hypothetical protein G6F24_018299 [Rhizopus arrhizus]|nr:hypothetical protein G6F24_018299 [Rhizopus arrhizus]